MSEHQPGGWRHSQKTALVSSPATAPDSSSAALLTQAIFCALTTGCRNPATKTRPFRGGSTTALRRSGHLPCFACRSLHDLPVEVGAGVGFSAGGNVGMTNNVFHRIIVAQEGKQLVQPPVLNCLETLRIATFQFDPERKIIAARAAAPCGLAGVPGASLAGDELDQLAIAPDQKVCRNTQLADVCEIRMGVRVEALVNSRMMSSLPNCSGGRLMAWITISEIGVSAGRSSALGDSMRLAELSHPVASITRPIPRQFRGAPCGSAASGRRRRASGQRRCG